jgi:AcrR family transcriptional regulator
MMELAADLGYERVTVRALTRTAGVSSRTFYSHFANRDECLVSTIDSVGHEILRRAAQSRFDKLDWQGQVRASLGSLLRDLAGQPRAAQLLLVEVFAAGRPARTRATELTAEVERLLARLLAPGVAAVLPPPRLVVGIAAGIVRVATMTTLTGRADELGRLAGELGDWVIDTYDERAVALNTWAQRRHRKGGRREPLPLPASLSAIDGHGDGDRILSATSRIASGSGFAKLTASKIRREAGVSRHSFDTRFGDATECFLAAVESLARTAAVRADAWAAGTGGKEHRSYRTVLALCAMAARNQSHARLVLAMILAPGRVGLLGRERLISAAAERLMETRQAPPRQSPLAPEASVAAAWRIAQREIVAGRGDRLPRSAPLLSALVVGRQPAVVPS